MTGNDDHGGGATRESMDALSEPERFWEAARVAYERIRTDPAERRAWREEIDAWDGTLMDGLHPDETFEEPDRSPRRTS